MNTERLPPSDPALPHLATALDERAMLALFAQHMRPDPAIDLASLACKIERVKYRPGRNCIVGYKLAMRERVTGALHEQWLSGGVYTPDEVRARHEKFRQSATLDTLRFPPVFAVAAIDMVAWTFPNERKLDALPAMSDSKRLREEVLPEVVRARWGKGWAIARLDHTIVSYFPEHTCSIKVRLRLRHGGSGALKDWDVFGKTRYDDAGATVLKHMQALWEADGGDVAYARPILYQPAYRLLWQESVPGVTLESLLGQTAPDAALLARVARAIAALHRTPLAEARPFTLVHIEQGLALTRELLERVRPDVGTRIAPAIRLLLETSGRLDRRVAASLHGDLHANNILVDGERIFLIDLDRASYGPPIAELGSFLAEIIYRACLHGSPVPWQLLARMVRVYRSAVPWNVPDREVRWYTAAALVHERIFRCLTSLKPGRMAIVPMLADTAMRLVRHGMRDEPGGMPPLHAFAEQTDAAAMHAFWRDRLPALFGVDHEVTHCAITYARCRTYLKPASWNKSYLCVCYRLELAGSGQPALLYGRAYLDGRSLPEQARLRAAARGKAHRVPEMDMIVWQFPDDPGLPQLPGLLSRTEALRHLPYHALPVSRAEDISHIDIQLVRYRPEQRCILRYDIRHGTAGKRLVLYAKVFKDDAGERVFARMRHCHDLGAALGARVARPLHYSATLGTVWQEAVSGTPLADRLTGAAGRETMRAIGRCLARLHAIVLPMSDRVSREARLADADKKTRKLAQAFPELAGSLESLVGRLRTGLANLPPPQENVIHGDMHLGQFLLMHDNSLALFDFDEWRTGDPAQDLADLIVDAHVGQPAQVCIPPLRLPELAQALLASYRSCGGQETTDVAIAWNARIQLINKAYRAAIQQEAHWQKRVPELAMLADRGIALGTAHEACAAEPLLEA